jgi:hypothetical protein
MMWYHYATDDHTGESNSRFASMPDIGDCWRCESGLDGRKEHDRWLTTLYGRRRTLKGFIVEAVNANGAPHPAVNHLIGLDRRNPSWYLSRVRNLGQLQRETPSAAPGLSLQRNKSWTLKEYAKWPT